MHPCICLFCHGAADHAHIQWLPGEQLVHMILCVYTPVMWHRIVGLMTLALDSMIEPSQSNAYPEASTILRSIVYSSSKLQGESG